MSVPVMVRDISIQEERWDAKLIPGDAFEFHDAAASPERIGWWELIRSISFHPEIRGSVGLVVDSELDRLALINSGREMIIEGSPLPPNFELLYGCGELRSTSPTQRLRTA